MKIFLKLILSITILGSAFELAATTPTPQPLVRNQNCPTGYHVSGQYCVPSDTARFALPRVGSCPSGYHASNNYCVASHDGSTLAILKKGTCPSGFYQSAQYCVSHR